MRLETAERQLEETEGPEQGDVSGRSRGLSVFFFSPGKISFACGFRCNVG